MQTKIQLIGIAKSLGFIVGNSALNPEDEDFIVAREIGRYIIEYKSGGTKGLYAYKDNDDRLNICENKIDLFTINLLMSSQNFKEIYNRAKQLYDSNEEKIFKALSKCFMVTLELVKIRIKELKLT